MPTREVKQEIMRVLSETESREDGELILFKVEDQNVTILHDLGKDSIYALAGAVMSAHEVLTGFTRVGAWVVENHPEIFEKYLKDTQ